MMSKRMRVNRGWGLITMSVAAIAALAAIVPGSGQGARGVNIYDPGDIIVADSVHQTVKAVDPVTGAASQITNAAFAAPYDVTFADDGDIFVVDRDAFGGTGGIRRLESTTGAQTAVTSNSLSAASRRQGADEESRSRSIARGTRSSSPTTRLPRKIIEVDIATGKQSLVTKAGALQSPFGIIDADGPNLLVSDASAFHNNNERGAVIEVNANTGKQAAVSRQGKFVFPRTSR